MGPDGPPAMPTFSCLTLPRGFPVTLFRSALLIFWALARILCLSSWRSDLALSSYLSPGHLLALLNTGYGKGRVDPAVAKDIPSGSAWMDLLRLTPGS